MILDNSNPSAGPAADSDGTAGKEDDGKANQDLRDMSPQGRYVKVCFIEYILNCSILIFNFVAG